MHSREAASGAVAAPAATGSIVSVQNVSRVYGSGHNAVRALKHVNLDVPPQKLVAITGRSGSGKTTLLNLMGGLDTPSEGKVLLEGRDLRDLSEPDRPR